MIGNRVISKRWKRAPLFFQTDTPDSTRLPLRRLVNINHITYIEERMRAGETGVIEIVAHSVDGHEHILYGDVIEHPIPERARNVQQVWGSIMRFIGKSSIHTTELSDAINPKEVP